MTSGIEPACADPQSFDYLAAHHARFAELAGTSSVYAENPTSGKRSPMTLDWA